MGVMFEMEHKEKYRFESYEITGIPCFEITKLKDRNGELYT